jgi:hypothetical protein
MAAFFALNIVEFPRQLHLSYVSKYICEYPQLFASSLVLIAATVSISAAVCCPLILIALKANSIVQLWSTTPATNQRIVKGPTSHGKKWGFRFSQFLRKDPVKDIV